MTEPQQVDADVFALAETLWSYHLLHQPLQKAECLLVLGNDDLRTAEYAAKLFLDGLADFVVISGQANRYSSHFLPLSEAEKFAEVMVDCGVDRGSILCETKATNTGENIAFTRALLEQRQSMPQSFLVVTRPYMERRALATFQKVWPGQDVTVTSLPTSLREFVDERYPFRRVANAMVGYVKRIQTYPQKGFQVEMEVPDEVLAATEKLEALGFTGT